MSAEGLRPQSRIGLSKLQPTTCNELKARQQDQHRVENAHCSLAFIRVGESPVCIAYSSCSTTRAFRCREAILQARLRSCTRCFLRIVVALKYMLFRFSWYLKLANSTESPPGIAFLRSRLNLIHAKPNTLETASCCSTRHKARK